MSCAFLAGSASAAYPGAPGLIAFTSVRGADFDAVRLIDVEGRYRGWLTPRLREQQRDPAWSPGGRWVMYTANGIWIVRPDGSGRRRIARHGTDGSWSPDGGRVVFVSKPTRAGCSDIYSMRLNGRALRKHTFTAACEENPSYSPDGKWIVFEACTDYANHVVVASTDQQRPERRTIGDGLSPDWSPDGATVAFASRTKVVIVDPHGRSRREVDLASEGHSEVYSLAWSPRGDALVVSQVFAPPCSIGVCRASPRILRVAPDGSDRRVLTEPGIDGDDQPAWQPIRR